MHGKIVRSSGVLLILFLFCLPASSQENPEAIIREAKAVVDDATKTVGTIKGLFNSRTSTEDQLTADLREQRTAASRLLGRIRSIISKSELTIQQIKFSTDKLTQQILNMEDLSDDDKSQISGPTAPEYIAQANSEAISTLNEASAQLKEINSKLDDLKKTGVDVEGERTKWEEATFRRPGSSISREGAAKTLAEIPQNLRGFFERIALAERTLSRQRAAVDKYQRVINIYKVIDSEKQNSNTLIELVKQLRDGESELDSLINKMDERFLSKINDTARKDIFTSLTTAIFGLAVIVVIVFFFRLANYDNVRISLFQNDSGLQFVTLFSIVIAIILFGVLKILEAKELSALLGGLSGYILGRGSIAGRPAGAPNAPLGPLPGPGPVPAPGPGPAPAPEPAPPPGPAPGPAPGPQ
jgi:hypothetical protein